jgi:hypothetical protein
LSGTGRKETGGLSWAERKYTEGLSWAGRKDTEGLSGIGRKDKQGFSGQEGRYKGVVWAGRKEQRREVSSEGREAAKEILSKPASGCGLYTYSYINLH